MRIRVNMSEFEATLRRYREFSRRTPEQICNTKAFFIARRATRETPKAKRLAAKLMRNIVTDRKEIGQRFSFKNGKLRKGQKIYHKFTAPLAALIVNARRAKAGEPGLYGADMEHAIGELIAARNRSIAFLRSGWIPSIKRLEPLADTRGRPRQDQSAKQFGREKGYANPSPSDTWFAKTIIANTAESVREMSGKAEQYLQEGLQRAFDAETQSMREYIERKMREAAQSAGVRTI